MGTFKFDDVTVMGMEPYDLFGLWFEDAQREELNDANAMGLACVDLLGRVSLRMVLLQYYRSVGYAGGNDGEDGFIFFTNFESDKGRALLENPVASLLFHWKSLRRQVRIEGVVSVVSDVEADDYFGSRPRMSRIGSWVSRQSRPLESRLSLQKDVAIATAKYGVGEIPRPPYWSGFCLRPNRIEFWQDGEFRLHDRFVFKRNDGSNDKGDNDKGDNDKGDNDKGDNDKGDKDVWNCERLYP